MAETWKRSAGIWGPVLFATASIAAARRQPGYSHRANHVSGLASLGQRSAAIMVPGFAVLAAAQSVLPAPSATLRRLVRAGALTTLVAGVVRVSDPLCPQPKVDPDVTATDVGHGAASIVTFLLWVCLPVTAARDRHLPAWYRRIAQVALAPTIAMFVLAGLTTRRASPSKGIAQRAFLGTIFLFMAATGLASEQPRR